MQLYSFFNSSTSYRVRIALALKGVAHTSEGGNIRVGAHRDAQYLAIINPSAAVAAIVTGDFRLGQSLAISDWLDAHHPEPQLIPAASETRARVLELAYLISGDIHPINNLQVLKYLEAALQISPDQKSEWYRNWIAEGMGGIERLLRKYGSGSWCFGEAPTLADCCLVPQIANALRMGCDLMPIR